MGISFKGYNIFISNTKIRNKYKKYLGSFIVNCGGSLIASQVFFFVFKNNSNSFLDVRKHFLSCKEILARGIFPYVPGNVSW
jgi:hypothetical protein